MSEKEKQKKGVFLVKDMECFALSRVVFSQSKLGFCIFLQLAEL